MQQPRSLICGHVDDPCCASRSARPVPPGGGNLDRDPAAERLRGHDRDRKLTALELEQFVLDPLVTPAGVLPGEPRDQVDDRIVDGWSAGPVWIGPLLRYQAAMPAQNRGGCDQAGVGGRQEIAADTTRRAPLDRPSPAVASGSFDATPRARGEEPRVRHCSTPTIALAVPTSRRAGRESDRGGVTTRHAIMPTAGGRAGPTSGTPQLPLTEVGVEQRG
jgi:hypothetical protein